jgi:putative transcriptional regulator
MQAATGRLLISEPFMKDPNFKRAVVLLTEYTNAGAMGFVLNHSDDILLGDILPDIAYSDIPVYIGGPVGADTLHFIHRCPEKIQQGIPVADGLYWGGDFKIVKELIGNYQLKPDEIRFFIGYSGWIPKQLDNEINGDSWIVTDKFNAELLFTYDEQELWRKLVVGLGHRYAHIANFPENPSLN